MPVPKNLLLVEDEPTLQRILGSVLSDAGHRVESVGSAEAALDRLGDTRAPEIDLVLSDKNLPAMNGLELLERTRQLEAEQGRLLGFMLVTGYPSRDSALVVLQHFGDGYLVKPFRSLMHAVADVQKLLDDDVKARRARARDARAVALLLGQKAADLPRDVPIALELHGSVRERAQAALAKAGHSVVEAAALPATGRAVLCASGLGTLMAAARAKPQLALVLCDASPPFDDLVHLIGHGGAAVSEAK